MNVDYEKRLETEIDRELKALPELSAPPTLAPRVLAAIGRRASLPGRAQSFQTWPITLQAAAVLFLVALFVGLCFAGWNLPQTPVFVAAMRHITHGVSLLGTVLNALAALAGAIALVVKNLGTGFLVALAVFLGLGYALCVSLGTVYVRLAFARR
jgi:hypothetical protein